MKLAASFMVIGLLAMTANSAPKAQAVLSLATWGAPWEPSFRAELFASGGLVLTKRVPAPSVRRLTERRASVQLAPADVQEVLAVARRAVASADFTKGCDKAADGTNAHIILRGQSVVLEADCVGASQWPAEGSSTSKLLQLLNKKVPRDVQIY